MTFAVKNGDAGAEFPRYPCRAAPKRRTRSDRGWLRSDQLGAERRFYFGVTSYRRAYVGFKGFSCGTTVAWSWDLCTGLPEQPREERAGKVLPRFCLALPIQAASLVLEPIRRTGYIGTCLTTPDLEPPSCLTGTQCDQGLTCQRVRALLGCCLRGPPQPAEQSGQSLATMYVPRWLSAIQGKGSGALSPSSLVEDTPQTPGFRRRTAPRCVMHRICFSRHAVYPRPPHQGLHPQPRRAAAAGPMGRVLGQRFRGDDDPGSPPG